MAGIVIWCLALASMFYFLIVRPQKKRVLAHRVLMAELAVGNNVITTGGIYGTVNSLDDETVDLEIADGLSIKVARSAIARIVRTDELVAP